MNVALEAKGRLLSREERARVRIVALFMALYRRLGPLMKRFAKEAAITGLRGQAALSTPAGVALVRAIHAELEAFGKDASRELLTLAADEFGEAIEDLEAEIDWLLPMDVTLNMAEPRHAYELFGFVAPDGPLYGHLNTGFGKKMAGIVVAYLIAKLIGGSDERAILGMLQLGLAKAMTEAMKLARTAILWTYRAATHANYLVNGDLISGWLWWAQLDERTCLSCINMHGSFHLITEILIDHHFGRCTPLPVVRPWGEIGVDYEGDWEDPLAEIEPGQAWFEALPVDQQEKMMGKAKYAAWKDGLFKFSDLSYAYTDPVWGLMLREASLKELLSTRNVSG